MGREREEDTPLVAFFLEAVAGRAVVVVLAVGFVLAVVLVLEVEDVEEVGFFPRAAFEFKRRSPAAFTRSSGGARLRSSEAEPLLGVLEPPSDPFLFFAAIAFSSSLSSSFTFLEPMKLIVPCIDPAVAPRMCSVLCILRRALGRAGLSLFVLTVSKLSFFEGDDVDDFFALREELDGTAAATGPFEAAVFV